MNRKRNNNRIPAANTRSMNRDFRILYQDGNTVKVTGRDLVYKIPSDIVDQDGTGIITVIPANPCYWLGTRIAALAQGYQNYRPLNMKFTYIPQCAVTQQGNVIAGTLWNQAPSNDNMQQSLRTSNGGQMSQCYKGFTSIVRLKSNLQYNLYKTAGQFDQESNPFLYIAMAVGCKQGEDHIIPGYFYVTWSFLLKNPIGNTNIFNNSGITTYGQVKENASYENKTIIFLTPEDDELQMGSIIQLEKDTDDQLQAYYNGSYYEMADEDIVWYFSNSTIAATRALEQKYKLYYRQEEEIDVGDSIACQFYFRTDYDDDTCWYATLYEYSNMVQPVHKTRLYYIPNLIQEAQQGGGLETAMPYFALGFLVDYELAQNPDRTSEWNFKIPKRMVEIEDISQNNNNNKTKTKFFRNKAILNKTKTSKVTKDKSTKNTNNIISKINEKAKTHKPKQYKNKIHDDELDAQFSASEIFQ